MSALPPKTGMCGANCHVCFGPQAAVRSPYSRSAFTGMLQAAKALPGTGDKVANCCANGVLMPDKKMATGVAKDQLGIANFLCSKLSGGQRNLVQPEAQQLRARAVHQGNGLISPPLRGRKLRVMSIVRNVEPLSLRRELLGDPPIRRCCRH